MEITRRTEGEVLELEIEGRLDAYWAGHLTSCLDDVIRDGHHRIRLELSKVAYISSAGIGVLVRYYKELNVLQGALLVSNPSPRVQKILELARLGELLAMREPAATAAAKPAETIATESAVYTLSRLARTSMSCTLLGQPELIVGCRFRGEAVRRLRCGPGTVGLGVGAFGEEHEACQHRFGEFFAVGGAAAYMPTDGTNVPDYMLPAGNFVPEVAILYGLVSEGNFALHARFEATAERCVDLSALASNCLDFADADAAVIVIVAESGGLLGAALRQSPARAARNGAPFSYPEVRDWLSFSPERLFTRSVALVTGVAVRKIGGPLDPVLRPLAGAGLSGHFHAGAFSYRPLKKAQTGLDDSVRMLFEGEVLEGVLHLLTDDRGNAPPAESRFLRGACWISSITEMTAERSRL